jgi:hypothetical protein
MLRATQSALGSFVQQHTTSVPDSADHNAFNVLLDPVWEDSLRSDENALRPSED